MRRGSALEVRLAAQHVVYLERGVARVHKTYAEARNVNGRIVYSAKGPPDFIGTIGGGRSVVFDAKESTRSPKFRLALVPQHQAKDLEAHARLGALVFIVASTTAGTWMLPWWPTVLAGKRRAGIGEAYWTGSTHLSPDQMDALGVRLNGVDWLEAA